MTEQEKTELKLRQWLKSDISKEVVEAIGYMMFTEGRYSDEGKEKVIDAFIKFREDDNIRQL